MLGTAEHLSALLIPWSAYLQYNLLSLYDSKGTMTFKAKYITEKQAAWAEQRFYVVKPFVKYESNIIYLWKVF